MSRRIERMQQFYRDGSKVCSFMSSDVTRFVRLQKISENMFSAAARQQQLKIDLRFSLCIA